MQISYDLKQISLSKNEQKEVGRQNLTLHSAAIMLNEILGHTLVSVCNRVMATEGLADISCNQVDMKGRSLNACVECLQDWFLKINPNGR